ncbi:unnamed protein product [Staurois parvus]|uniref:Uncharacterized protein n=1 Tax=Staurois parvus TaxID=386267 RepID=A0ABN9CNM4_9NEOB|nr:unnamed protein product [Staurois parvus]
MGPRAIGDHGAPVSLPKLKKAYEKGTRGISWSPLLTPGPWAVPEFPNGQSAPASGCEYAASTPSSAAILKTLPPLPRLCMLSDILFN